MSVRVSVALAATWIVLGAGLLGACAADDSSTVETVDFAVPIGESVPTAVEATIVAASVEATSTPSVRPPSVTTTDVLTATSTITTGAAPTVAEAPEPTCSAASWTAQVGDRAVLVRQPDAAGSVPIVIAIHGYKGTPDGLEYYSELTSTVGEAAIVAYPTGAPLDLGFGWNSGAGRFATDAADDVAVIMAALDLLVGLPCADPSRVFVVGESNGGGMAVRVACDQRMWGRLAGVVLVNAAIDDGVLSLCTPGAARVTLLATAGLADRVVPYDGSRDPFVPVESWFTSLAEGLAGCDPSQTRREPWTDRVEAITAGGCATCAELLVVSDGAHTWPGSFEGINGAIPGSFELSSLLAEISSGRRHGCGAASEDPQGSGPHVPAAGWRRG